MATLSREFFNCPTYSYNLVLTLKRALRGRQLQNMHFTPLSWVVRWKNNVHSILLVRNENTVLSSLGKFFFWWTLTRIYNFMTSNGCISHSTEVLASLFTQVPRKGPNYLRVWIVLPFVFPTEPILSFNIEQNFRILLLVLLNVSFNKVIITIQKNW